MLTGGYATSTAGTSTNMTSGNRGPADGVNNLSRKEHEAKVGATGQLQSFNNYQDAFWGGQKQNSENVDRVANSAGFNLPKGDNHKEETKKFK